MYLDVVEAVGHGGRLSEGDLGPGELVGAVEGDDGAQPHAVRQLGQLLDLGRERRQRGGRRCLKGEKKLDISLYVTIKFESNEADLSSLVLIQGWTTKGRVSSHMKQGENFALIRGGTFRLSFSKKQERVRFHWRSVEAIDAPRPSHANIVSFVGGGDQ